MRKLLSLTLALLVFAACDQAPTQTVEPPDLNQAVTDNDRSTFPFFLRSGCGGEAIEGESTIHLVVSSNQTPSGHVNIKLHWNIKGKGTGLESGAKYELNETLNQSVTTDADNMPFTVTATRRLRVIGQGQVPDRRLDFIAHATVNANGDIVRNEARFEDICS